MCNLVPRPCGRRKDGLVSTACTCVTIPEYFHIIISCTLSAYIDHIRTKYSKSNLRTHAPSQRLQCFSVDSVIQKCKRVYYCSLQWCGIAGRMAFSSAHVLLVLVENGNGSTNTKLLLLCRQNGKAWTETQGPLEAGLHSIDAQHWQVSRYPTCTRKHFLAYRYLTLRTGTVPSTWVASRLTLRGLILAEFNLAIFF